MAKYRALAAIFVRRLIKAGEEFESELPPSRNWEPLDDEARAAVAAYYDAKGAKVVQLNRLDPKRVEYSAVIIPENWRELSGPKRRALAQKLGAQSNVREADANSFIEAELEHRKQKASA